MVQEIQQPQQQQQTEIGMRSGPLASAPSSCITSIPSTINAPVSKNTDLSANSITHPYEHIHQQQQQQKSLVIYNNEKNSSSSNRALPPSCPQHMTRTIQQAEHIQQPTAMSINTMTSVDVPNTLPISVMALPHNSHLQPNTAASGANNLRVTSAVLRANQQPNQINPFSSAILTSSQHQHQIPQKVKLATVPTNKLAARSAISLNPSFLQILSNSKHHVSATSSTNDTPNMKALMKHIQPSVIPSTANDTTNTFLNHLKQQTISDANNISSQKSLSPGGKKRSLTDADSEQVMKLSKVSMPSPSKLITSNMTLQSYFENLLRSRGYSANNYCSLENAYYSKPTALQMASHGVKVIQGVRKSDTHLVTRLLKAGLSPNPCNKFGESIIHMICRRGDSELLKIFVKFGCSLQVCDDFGRTPLHDACWTSEPKFEVVELILRSDRRLMNIVDCRGSSPLSYVKRDHWGAWIQFFERVKDQFWSHRDVKVVGEEPPPDLVGKAPNSITLGTSKDDPVLKDIESIAMGKVEPESIIRVTSGSCSENSVSDLKGSSVAPPIIAEASS